MYLGGGAVVGLLRMPQAVVDACDAGWAKIKASGVCPSYERGTSLF